MFKPVRDDAQDVRSWIVHLRNICHKRLSCLRISSDWVLSVFTLTGNSRHSQPRSQAPSPGPANLRRPVETCGDLWPSFGEICCFFSRFECPHHHIAIQPIRGLGPLQSTNERRQNLRQPLHHHNPRVIYDAGSSGTLDTGARGHNFISHVLLLLIIPQHDVVNKTTNYHQTPELWLHFKMRTTQCW